FQPTEALQAPGRPYRYRGALEPTHQTWWLALDTPAQSPASNVSLTYDNQLVVAEPVREPLSYDAVSYLRTRSLEPLSASSRREDSARSRGNPRSLALAQTLRQRAGPDAEFVTATLEYLHRGGFVYSLTPEPLGADAIDDFLFNTR